VDPALFLSGSNIDVMSILPPHALPERPRSGSQAMYSTPQLHPSLARP